MTGAPPRTGVIAAHQVGDGVWLTLTRSLTGEPRTVTIILGELPVDGGTL